MRILMLNYEYPPLGGGSSPVTRSLARTLVGRGHDVDVVTMGFRGLPHEQDDGGVRVIRVPAFRRRRELSRVHEMATYVVSAVRRVGRLTRENAYDVCHAHFILPTAPVAYALRARAGFPPYVVTAHGSDVPGYNPDRFRLAHRISPPALRRLLAAAAALIVPSRALERLIARVVPAGAVPLVRVPYGIDAWRFEPATKEDSVLVAARLFERKGTSHLVEALAGLETGYRLDVAGDGPCRGDLERNARALGVRARFLGWLEHSRLDRLFERSRIFVLATASDNFPASLLEAMAARCAIVTTRAGGCPEVVGDAALLVEPGDVDGLRESLRRLMGDRALCAELGERAWRRARELFDWEVIAARHEEVYAAAAGLRRETSGRRRAQPAAS